MRAERVVATWSGGIDSTAVIANLLAEGCEVLAITLEFGGLDFIERERRSREAVRPALDALPGTLTCWVDSGKWLYAFSNDGVEIPTRNKRIMDHLIAVHCMPRDVHTIAMGEYIGCDTWVVRDHVGASDCDARSLTAYLYNEYGMDWRLVTLADFGESRYKSDRLALGVNVIGEAMELTTNCLEDTPGHCGACYKCLERHAAFHRLGLSDRTEYAVHPGEQPQYGYYIAQMSGEDVSMPYAQVAR